MAMLSRDKVRAYRARQKAKGEPDVTQNNKLKIRREYHAWSSAVDPHCRPELARKTTRQTVVAERTFTGCDGEGCGSDKVGRQNYMLFRMGERELYTGKPLETVELLDFILGHASDELLVGFSFGYDATMILRDLEPERIARLMGWKLSASDDPTTLGLLAKIEREAGSGYSLKTWWKDYALEYLPKNYLRVSRTMRTTELDARGERKRQIVPGSTRTIYDVFGNFQKSFVWAIKTFEVGSQAERDRVEREKDKRSTFKTITPTIRRYCALECRMLAELMEAVRKYAFAADIEPKNWAGAGKMAEALHHKHGTPGKDDVSALLHRDPAIAVQIIEFAERGYYGGRFEVSRFGHLGRNYGYDINSAYPAGMLELPCLEHGTWRKASADQVREHDKRGGLYICEVTFRLDDPKALWAGLPIRGTSGGIYYPRQGGGVYWSIEIASARELGQQVTLGPGWTYHEHCSCRQFEWVRELYDYRKSLASKAQGHPIKLTIASLYGKLVQRVGSAPFYNPIWGGLVTAWTRAKINGAIALNPKAITMTATDGIYSLEPLPLELGPGLGQWEADDLQDMFAVQPGLYWDKSKRHEFDKKDGKGKRRSRGLSTKLFDAKRTLEFEAAWDDFQRRDRGRLSEFPRVKVPFVAFIGLKVALARRKPELAGRWMDDSRELSFDYSKKRFSHRWQGGAIVTGLIPGHPGLRSLPQRALAPGVFDALEQFREIVEEQPNWIDTGRPFNDD